MIAEAAFSEGYEVKTSELHGLSQRGGSVDVHVRFGKKIYSPLIGRGKADLILGLEMQEALRGLYFANSKTKFLINKQIMPIPMAKSTSEQEMMNIFSKSLKNTVVVPAAEICQKNLGTSVVSGIYLVSLAVFQGFIPLKPASVIAAIKKVIAPKYFDLNKKTFDLAEQYGKK